MPCKCWWRKTWEFNRVRISTFRKISIEKTSCFGKNPFVFEQKQNAGLCEDARKKSAEYQTLENTKGLSKSRFMLRKMGRNPEPGIQGNVREGSFCLIKTDALMFLPRSFSHVKVMSVDNGHLHFC